MKNQNTNFDFSRRISRFNNDYMGKMKVCYDEELASSEGMHFHCWVPKTDPNKEIEFYTLFKIEAKNNRDCVSFSWDYLPDVSETK